MANNPTDLTQVGNDGYVSAEDVLFLRRNVFADGVVSASELDAVFALGEKAEKGDREWFHFFAEVVSDFYLREEEPHGYFTQDEFNSFKARVTRDGDKASGLEIGVMLKVLETAVSTPPDMTGFIGEQIKRHVMEKEGGAVIDSDDVKMISRFIFAAGGDGNVAVTKAEAELLFDLSDATARVNNAPEWNDFFKKAISNHLMAHIGFNPLGRRDALSHYTPDPTDGGPIEQVQLKDENAFDRSRSSTFDMLMNIFTPKAAHRRRVERRHREANERREAEAAVAEKITPEEADWVADRIGRDGVLHPSEKALIQYMRDELDADLPPKLKALAERAA